MHLKGEKRDRHHGKSILSQNEIKHLFSACDVSHMNAHFQQRDKVILVLLYSCGLRRTEAVSLNTGDILFEKKRIYVRKGKNYKERFVPINTHNLKILEDYVFEARLEFLKHYQTDALILSHTGRRIGGVGLSNRLKGIIDATEDEVIQSKAITLHSLRHSIATHLLQNNVPIQSISTFLGHSSLESTEIYTHLVDTLESET